MIYLILPSFNEEKNLVKIFKKIDNLKIARSFVVILVDDCSSDNTSLLKLNKNKFDDAIKEIKEKTGSLACFSIDTREQEKLDWLKKMGLQSETKCKIFSFSPFSFGSIKSNTFYISTGEI